MSAASAPPPPPFQNGTSPPRLVFTSDAHLLVIFVSALSKPKECGRCFVWLQGPVLLPGLVMRKMCGNDTRTARIDLDGRCPPSGEYLIWISCLPKTWGGKNPPSSVMDFDAAARVGSFKENAQIKGSPFSVAIDSLSCRSSSSRRRSEVASMNATASRLAAPGNGWLGPAAQPGWWAARSNPSAAQREWHYDSYQWRPFQAPLSARFMTRAEFPERWRRCSRTRVDSSAADADSDGDHRQKPTTIVLIGDSMMRGIFCDLVNWWYFKLDPQRLLHEDYHLNRTTLNSSLDGRACGFNVPTGPGAMTPPPEMLVTKEELGPTWEAAFRNHTGALAWTLELPHNTNVVFHVATGAELLGRALQLLAADKWTLMGRAVRGVAMVACHWDLYYIAKKRTEKVKAWWLAIKAALEGFAGLVVLASCAAKHNMNDLGPIDEEFGGLERIIRNVSLPQTWHRLDLFSSSIARPDRTSDSFHFFPRKCGVSPQHHVCELGRRDVDSCCLPPNAMPFPVSSTWTAMLLNLFCPVVGAAHSESWLDA